MSFFSDDEGLNDMYNDWERRMREHRKKLKDEGKDESEENTLSNLFGSITDFSTSAEDYSKLSELGEPDTIEEFEENGLKFLKKIWKTDEGEYILVESVGSIVGSDLEEILKNAKSGPFTVSELTLEESLEDALEEENYEEAARLRDVIKEKEINDSLFNKK